MPQPIALNPTLPQTIPQSLRKFARDVAAIIDEPLAHASVSADAEGTVSANKHRITIQVRNRRGDRLAREFLVHLWLATTNTGPPQTAQAVAYQAGTVLETVLANGEWWVASNTDGQIILDVTIAGAATRYVRAFVVAQIDTSDPITWS